MGSEPARERVGSEPARERVGSEPARERVGSEPARERVGSEPARERVGSEPASQRAEIHPRTPAFEREIIELPGRPVRLHIRSARARCDEDLPFQVASLLSHASHGPSPSPESSTRRWTLLPALTPQQSHCHT